MTSNNRSFGVEMSANRQFNHEFTPEQRATMLGELSAGKTLTEVASDFNTTPSTVYKTKRRWETYLNNGSRPRKGRPRKLTKLQIIRINSFINRNCSITWNDLILELQLDISKRSLQRHLHSHWRRKWRSKRRIELSEENAKERLEFARYWIPRVNELLQVNCSER